jgi:hypothetical protein
MMLKCIKSLVSEKGKPFAQVYAEYIMKVQDENIDREVNRLLYSKQTKVRSVNLAIDQMLKDINK